MLNALFLLASFWHPHVLQNAQAEATRIEVNGDTYCSATAIGPHALLTAAHCLPGMKTLKVGGITAKVEKIVLDDEDHAIVYVDRTFQHCAGIKVDVAPGDEVFILGNPWMYKDLYRRGYVSGYVDAPQFKARATMYDLNGFFGDSGSGIFDSAGNVVGVISFVVAQTDEGVTWTEMASLPLHFTPGQLKEAKHANGS